jgi:hypothetical protein
LRSRRSYNRVKNLNEEVLNLKIGENNRSIAVQKRNAGLKNLSNGIWNLMTVVESWEYLSYVNKLMDMGKLCSHQTTDALPPHFSKAP